MTLSRRPGGSIPKKDRINYEDAARLYREGMSTTQVAAALGTTSCTVNRALRTLGVPRRGLSESVSLRHRGNRRLDTGYITVCCGPGVRKKEHVLIAESVLMRPLKKGEVVHHINGVKTDNRKCNLLICSKSYHSWLHWRLIQIQRKENNNEYSKPTVGLDCTAEYQRRFDG